MPHTRDFRSPNRRGVSASTMTLVAVLFAAATGSVDVLVLPVRAIVCIVPAGLRALGVGIGPVSPFDDGERRIEPGEGHERTRRSARALAGLGAEIVK